MDRDPKKPPFDVKYLGKENVLDIYGLNQKPHFNDEANKIKIVHVGTPNSLPTKTVMLMGETGAGKTTLINAVYNHFCGVKFEDGYRMKIEEEEHSARDKEIFESQTEEVTGYLFYSQPSGTNTHYNIMIIDTPGLNDTREKDEQIINQMKVFLSQERFGVLDLHCLALVVKSNETRALKRFKEIVEKCLGILGSDTKSITSILKTHAIDKKSFVSKILQKWEFFIVHEFDFDNGILYEPNVVGSKTSEGEECDIDDIQGWAIRWKKQKKNTDIFLETLSTSPCVSLRLTKQALVEKFYLEENKQNLSEQIESALNHIKTLKENREMLLDYEKNIEENRNWKGTRKAIAKTFASIDSDRRWYQFGAHVHNCLKCEKTCTRICHIWISCPTGTCTVCRCPFTVHEKSPKKIVEKIVKEPVTDKDMKQSYQKAVNRRDYVEKAIKDDEVQERKLLEDIARMVKHISLQLERLNEICTLPNHQSADEIAKNFIEDSIKRNLHFHDLKGDDCNAYIQSLFKTVENIEIDRDGWLEHIKEITKGGESLWDRATKDCQLRSGPKVTDHKKAAQ